jgi:hypothetical protein
LVQFFGWVLLHPEKTGVVGIYYWLAQMANTAFAGHDLAGRKIGMKEQEDAVDNAVRQEYEVVGGYNINADAPFVSGTPSPH